MSLFYGMYLPRTTDFLCVCLSFFLILRLSKQDELLNGSLVVSELQLIPLDISGETITVSSTKPNLSDKNDLNSKNERKPANGMSNSGQKTSLKTINAYTSSTRIYIVAIIGIVPAILGGLVYWLNYFRKTCFKGKRKKQQLSGIKVHGLERNVLRHYGFAEKEATFGKATNKSISSSTGTKSEDKIIKTSTSSISTSPPPTSTALSSNSTKLTYSIEYPRENLELLEILGEGNFGQVCKARVTHLRETYYVAVKTNKAECNDTDNEDLLQELNIMLKLGKHPNVVRLLACCTDKVPYYLIMEYVECGKLLNYIRQYRTENRYYNDDYCKVAIAELILFSYHAAKGMEFISSFGIIHRDLAARNILVSRDRVCKVADFGLARFVTDSEKDEYEQKTRGVMPIRWMAPESLTKNIFTTKSDVWSFGVLLWEILTLGSTPYPAMTASEVVHKVRCGYMMERPPGRWCNNNLYWLMRACWSMDPKMRPDFGKIRQILGQMLNNHSEYVDLNDLQSSAYYNIMYSSPGEKV